jgi:hypothetical protein
MLKVGLITLTISFTGVAFLFGTNVKQSGFFVQPLNSGGASPGMTGAPGEANCTQCHSGNTQMGTSENLLTISSGGVPVNSYMPGQQYTVTLSMASNPAKRGFQATALTPSNIMAGAFSEVAGNTSINGGVKRYANHTSTSNTSASAPSWTWTWTAPSAGTGTVTFYVATNKTNNNGNDNGDMIYLSQHPIDEASNALHQISLKPSFTLISTKPNHWVIDWSSSETSIKDIDVVDGSGKRVFHQQSASKQANTTFELDVPSLGKGIYILSFSTKEGRLEKKISIQ